ncbi:MAG: M48 family metallopeptidase [Pyrinomonadaceae bacterium]
MKLNYSIVYSNRKTMSIVIERDRSVIVRVPHDTSEEFISREIEKRKRGILKKINHNQKYPIEKQTKEFISGESLLYLGKNYQLSVIDKPIGGVIFADKFIIGRHNQKRAKRLFKDWYHNAATEIIVPKAVSLAKQIGVSFNKISILDLKYRWGSCTPKDNIHFNWRLIKAPMNVIEYIIIHELTHLLEANHTPEFWSRIRTSLPRYAAAKKWLIDYGYELEIDL